MQIAVRNKNILLCPFFFDNCLPSLYAVKLYYIHLHSYTYSNKSIDIYQFCNISNISRDILYFHSKREKLTENILELINDILFSHVLLQYN